MKSNPNDLMHQTFDQGIDHPLSKRDVPATPKDAALSFLASRLGVDSESLSYRTGYSGEAAHHVYVKQKIVSQFRHYSVPLFKTRPFRTVLKSPTLLRTLPSA